MAHRIFSSPWNTVYPLYVAKVERKGASVDDLDRVITWLTGYTADDVARLAQPGPGPTVEEFFAQAPALNPDRELITGSICGIKVQEVEDPLMRDIRYLDKLVDEVAKGRPMSKVLRTRAE